MAVSITARASTTPQDGSSTKRRESRSNDVGVCVAVVDDAFTFNGRDYRQREHVFSVRVQESFCRPVAFAGEIKRAAHLGHRWWDVGQVLATEHNLYPAALPELLTRPRKSL